MEIFPGDRAALIAFSVSRDSIPAGGTVLLTWDPLYNPKFPVRANIRAVQFSPVLAKDDVQLVLSGPNLLFYSLGGDATNYGLLDGSILFPYA